jgi:glycosyltransferase involved in cell wall biosynthesis
MKRPKLLVTGIEPPDEMWSWSGIPFHLSQSLAKNFDLCFVGNLRGKVAARFKIIGGLCRRLKWRGLRDRSEPTILREFAERLRVAIEQEKPDAILSISCEPIAYLPPGLPAYIIHDSTFRQLLNGYSQFEVLWSRSLKTSEEAQKRGFARATATFPASEWARQSTLSDYGLDAAKVKVMPMGANLLDPPSREEVSVAIEERLASPVVNFLFVGVDWHRKGGAAAVSVVQSLVRRGIPAKLHIVGCAVPPELGGLPFVIAHGFLRKNIPEQATQLRSLFQTASFFIVPSLAECYGCVFCEAFAFGTPCISRDTGGISEIIKNEKTGFLLSDHLPEERIVDHVVGLIENKDRYREMALRARTDFEDRLNWDVYAKKLKDIIMTDAAAGSSGS